MQNRHEPDNKFVENLEWQLQSELRRLPRSVRRYGRRRRFGRTAALMAFSVAFGAAIMAASQRIEESWQTEMLRSNLELHLGLAHQRVDLAAKELARVEEKIEIGVINAQARTRAAAQFEEADAQTRTIELELEEIELSGREPRDGLASPLVDGRDFVSERINVRVDVVVRQMAAANAELEQLRRRYEAGVISADALAHTETAMLEAVAQERTLARQIEIRMAFVDGELSGTEAELLVLQANAEERADSMQRELAQAATDLQRAEQRVELGVVNEQVRDRARLRLMQVETELQTAESELEFIKRALKAHNEQR